jgi:spermidine/putrescine transport system substrate-binding protein
VKGAFVDPEELPAQPPAKLSVRPNSPPPLPAIPSVSRRVLIRGAGLAGTAALLAACGIKGTSGGETSPATTAAAGGATTSATGTSAATAGGSATSGAAATSGSGSASGGSATSGGGATSSEILAGGATSAAPSVPDKSDTDKVVNWSSWPEYLDVDPKDPNKHPSIDAFTKQTGIKVNYTEDVNDNDEYFAKIEPLLSAHRAITADVFVVTDWMVDKLIRLGYLQEIDHSLVPNIKNLNPALLDVPFDKGRKMSLTWQSGLTGIAYNPDATGGKAVESIDQLLTDSSLKGKVTLLTEMRDTVGLTLLDMGADPESFTDAQFNAAIAKLQTAVSSGQVRQFTGNDYGQGLVSGDIAACIAWTGDVVQLQPDNPSLKYVLPEKGCMLWSDNFVIPIMTPHKKNAELLMNFYYDPQVAAQVADQVNYITPVVGAKEFLIKDDPDVAKNQLIFPPASVMNRAHVFMGLTQDQETRYNAAFAKLTGS